MNARELLSLLPGWWRSRWALAIPLLLIAVPVVVNVLRDSHFDTTLEVFPTTPPGNAAASSDDLAAVRAVVANPGFQLGTSGWDARPGSALKRSTATAYSGSSSLASIRDRRRPIDGAIASTEAVLPVPGRYRVQARVRLPSDYSGGPPEVRLKGFSGSEPVAVRPGDPSLRERWQLIASDYVVGPRDRHGIIVLRTAPALPGPRQVLHWDDVRVLSNDVNLPAPDEVNLVLNPGFEHDRSGWGDAPVFKARRSERHARTGSGSLRSSTAQQAPADTNAGHTYVVFPRAGTYRVRAWVYLPSNAPAGQPGVFLEGFSGSTQLGQRLGDPGRRGRWQWVSADYAISPQDLEGSLVLRAPPAPAQPAVAASGVGAERAVYWDDVSVTAPRPAPSNEARRAAARLRSALEEPQLRSDVARITADADLYDPRRATIERSPRQGALSFIVRVANNAPGDANRLADPLRASLLDAARRGARREAEKNWQQLIAIVGDGLSPRQRALLQQRAYVLQRMIGAQPANVVAPPAPVRDPKVLTQAQQQRVHEDRQKIIARIGEDLPPWQRTLVQLQADNVQRMLAADTAEFVVLPPDSSVEPTRPVDRLLAALPGAFPLRVEPVWAGAAGLMCALLLFTLVAMSAQRRRAVSSRH